MSKKKDKKSTNKNVASTPSKHLDNLNKEKLKDARTIKMEEDEKFKNDINLSKGINRGEEKKENGKLLDSSSYDFSGEIDGIKLPKMTVEDKINDEFPIELENILEVTDSDILAQHLSYLQRRLKELKVPVMIVLEGAYASGKGRVANELLLGLDARYTKFYATKHPSEEDLKKPFLSQYFDIVPNYNNFTIFYRSWYSLFSYYKTNKINKDIYKNHNKLIDEIKSFEKTLTDDGYVLLKFKIRINPKKQAEHIEKMLKSPLTTWKAQEYDKDNNESYVKEMEKLIKETDKDYAPWYIIEYTNKKETTTKVMKQVIKELEAKLVEVENREPVKPMDKDGDFTGVLDGPLSKVNLNSEISDDEYSIKLKDLQDKMREIQFALYQEKIPMVLVFEGWDAAGKGGAIHRILAKLDPTNYTVNTTAAPNDVEKNHHYLWRFAKEIPKAGHIAIWDRSWYGRVMVERVEGFAKDAEWNRAYDEINHFENLLNNFRTIIIKFYIHIDKETQLERFEARANNPAKSWKITDEDWRNRDKWDKYTEAVNDMINKTSKEEAPWIIIEGNSKKYARIKVLENIISICDKKLKLINYSDEDNSDSKDKKNKKK